MSVANLGVGCPGRREQSAFEPGKVAFFAVETLAFECPRALEKSTLRYDLFFDLDPRHQGMALVELPVPRANTFFAKTVACSRWISRARFLTMRSTTCGLGLSTFSPDTITWHL